MTWYSQPNISSWTAFGTMVNGYVNNAYGNVILAILFVIFFSVSIKKGIATAFATGAVFSMISATVLLVLGWVGPNSILVTMALSGIGIILVTLGGMKDGI